MEGWARREAEQIAVGGHDSVVYIMRVYQTTIHPDMVTVSCAYIYTRTEHSERFDESLANVI